MAAVKIQFVSHLEGPEAMWLLVPAVHCHHGPVYQASTGGVIGPRVQKKWYGAGWRLQAYRKVTATHSVDADSHLVRDKWQEIKEKGGVKKEIDGGMDKQREGVGGQTETRVNITTTIWHPIAVYWVWLNEIMTSIYFLKHTSLIDNFNLYITLTF